MILGNVKALPLDKYNTFKDILRGAYIWERFAIALEAKEQSLRQGMLLYTVTQLLA